MEVKKLDRKIYEGRKFTLQYITNGYYNIAKSNTGFQIEYKRFEKPTEMSFDDYMFNEWLEDPVSYGAFENGQLLGYVEGTLEKWNNRYRISNISVFDNTCRHSGIGTALMNTILKEAKESGARMVLILLDSICSPTPIQTQNGTKSELRWESNYESKTYNYRKQLPQRIFQSRMSFTLMCLHYKTVLPWIMDANEIFSLMRNVQMGAEFASMVR